MKRLAILASGTGSNALEIIRHFKARGMAEQLSLVASNRESAPVLEVARAEGVDTHVFSADDDGFRNLQSRLAEAGVELIALAGFLKLIPPSFLSAFRGVVVNIHPSLLPKFGGPGMYGRFVHEAVISSGETRSGCTIHVVDEEYDKGPIIAQFQCSVFNGDDAGSIASRVLSLEHYYYPRVLERLCRT